MIIYTQPKRRKLNKNDTYNFCSSWSEGLQKSRVISEKTTRAKIDLILKKYNGFWIAPVSFGMGKVGVPDVIACVNGKFVGIEAKGWKTGHILTEEQKNIIKKIKEAGGYTMVVNPFNLDKLDDLLKELSR